MRPAVLRACVGVAVGAAVTTALVIGSGGDCDDFRFDRTGWSDGDRDEYAACVIEVQPFRGLEDEALVRRLGRPDERRRAELRWWLGADDDFGMKIEALAIPIDDRGRAGSAHITRSG